MKQQFKLSQSQLGIFAECMQHPEEPVYDQPFFYTLSKEVDLSALKAAILKAVEAHPNMKCGVIIDDEGVPKQFIHDDPLEIPIEKIDDINKVKDNLWKPFHFDGSPLTRIRLYEDNTAKYMFIQSHHLLFDGTTFGTLFNDIENIYHGGEATEEQVTAFEYAEEEETLRHSDRMEEDRQWYVEHFPDPEVETILHPDLAGKEPSYVRVILPLKTPMNEVMTFCKQHGIKISNYMCGAYALLMARFNADDQVLFSTIWHGRPCKELMKTAGMFVKTVPYYYHLKEEDTVADLLRQGDEMVVG
ncbi:MAG: hypothetical protein IKH64_05365, partial [Prevotella sp.]|nr:hypothetical protein [Prevotella sp.]